MPRPSARFRPNDDHVFDLLNVYRGPGLNERPRAAQMESRLWVDEKQDGYRYPAAALKCL